MLRFSPLHAPHRRSLSLPHGGDPRAHGAGGGDMRSATVRDRGGRHGRRGEARARDGTFRPPPLPCSGDAETGQSNGGRPPCPAPKQARHCAGEGAAERNGRPRRQGGAWRGRPGRAKGGEGGTEPLGRRGTQIHWRASTPSEPPSDGPPSLSPRPVRRPRHRSSEAEGKAAPSHLNHVLLRVLNDIILVGRHTDRRPDEVVGLQGPPKGHQRPPKGPPTGFRAPTPSQENMYGVGIV